MISLDLMKSSEVRIAGDQPKYLKIHKKINALLWKMRSRGLQRFPISQRQDGLKWGAILGFHTSKKANALK